MGSEKKKGMDGSCRPAAPFFSPRDKVPRLTRGWELCLGSQKKIAAFSWQTPDLAERYPFNFMISLSLAKRAKTRRAPLLSLPLPVDKCEKNKGDKKKGSCSMHAHAWPLLS